MPVAKRLVVYRGGRHEFTQEEIEAQAGETKDKGEFYIKEVQDTKGDSDGLPLHRRVASSKNLPEVKSENNNSLNRLSHEEPKIPELVTPTVVATADPIMDFPEALARQDTEGSPSPEVSDAAEE